MPIYSAEEPFVIFAGPHSERAKARYVLGGYTVGILVGAFCYYGMVEWTKILPTLGLHFDEIFAARAADWGLFCMVVLDFKHPPACAAALALVINDWNLWTLFITFLALFILVISRHILRKHLIQLI